MSCSIVVSFKASTDFIIAKSLANTPRLRRGTQSLLLMYISIRDFKSLESRVFDLKISNVSSQHNKLSSGLLQSHLKTGGGARAMHLTILFLGSM